MDIRTFRENRAKFTWDELAAYDGRWVAFSPDGSRIVASAVDLGELEPLIRAAGEDPDQVGYERIEFDDQVSLGAAEYF